MSIPQFNSPLGAWWDEDFVTNDSSTDAAIGKMLWEFDAIGNAGTYTPLTSTNANSVDPGGIRHLTAGTADGDGDAMRLDVDAIVLSGAGGFFEARIRYPDITGNVIAANDFRLGLGDSVTATDSTVGIWVESEAGVLALQADSADHGDRRVAVARVPTLTSGTTMVLGTTHHLRVDWSGENAQGGPDQVVLRVDGFEAAKITDCQIDNDEEMEVHWVSWQDSGGAATYEQDLFYFCGMVYRAELNNTHVS